MPTAHALLRHSDGADFEELERSFFGAIRLPNGTFKTTYPNRLDDLNDLVLPLIPDRRPLLVVDVAVSSGISTLEWSASLERAGIDHRIEASDAYVHAKLHQLVPGLRVLALTGGQPVQFDIFGRALPNPPRRRDRVGYLPFLLLLRSIARRRGRPLARSKPFPLVARALSAEPQIEIVEETIGAGPAETRPGDVVRAANILNRGYFDDATLAEMARQLARRLRPDGLLVVVRTDCDGLNHGTVFRRVTPGSLERVARLGDGSEIEPLVESLRLDS
jgi:hypothetical protein